MYIPPIQVNILYVLTHYECEGNDARSSVITSRDGKIVNNYPKSNLSIM